MSEPFLGEIRICSFGFAPRGWALCDGQLLPINQNQALFSILGTTYGGDGRVNFALPDLRGRMPIGFGAANALGERGGEYGHALTQGEMPLHTHAASGSAATADSGAPGGRLWASGSGQTPFSNSFNVAMAPGTVSSVGGSQAHANLGPSSVVNFVIALQGIFPSQS